MNNLKNRRFDSEIKEAHHLVEAYEKGELKGKLKEVAATLEEDDNLVIMLIKQIHGWKSE